MLVVNNTMVFPARLHATKDKSDAKVEVFLLRELSNDLWEAMVKPARKVRIGNKLWFSDQISCDVIDNTVSGGRVLRFDYQENESIYSFINKVELESFFLYLLKISFAGMFSLNCSLF